MHPSIGIAKSTAVAGQFKVFDHDFNDDYRVASTDYTSYAYVYSCKNTKGSKSIANVWLLSRTPTVSAPVDTAF